MVATLCNNSRFVVTDPDDDSKAPLNLVRVLGLSSLWPDYAWEFFYSAAGWPHCCALVPSTKRKVSSRKLICMSRLCLRLQEKEKENPDFNMLSLVCTGDASGACNTGASQPMPAPCALSGVLFVHFTAALCCAARKPKCLAAVLCRERPDQVRGAAAVCGGVQCC